MAGAIFALAAAGEKAVAVSRTWTAITGCAAPGYGLLCR